MAVFVHSFTNTIGSIKYIHGRFFFFNEEKTHFFYFESKSVLIFDFTVTVSFDRFDPFVRPLDL